MDITLNREVLEREDYYSKFMKAHYPIESEIV